MTVEVTIVCRFEYPGPNEDDFRNEIEEVFDCVVVAYDEEEV